MTCCSTSGSSARGGSPGEAPQTGVHEAAQRFDRLRRAALRLQMQNTRELRSLMPGPAPETRGRLLGLSQSAGRTGRHCLSV